MQLQRIIKTYGDRKKIIRFNVAIPRLSLKGLFSPSLYLTDKLLTLNLYTVGFSLDTCFAFPDYLS